MTGVTGRRIELWVEPRAGQPAVNPVMRALLDRLTDDGADVVVRVPEWRPRSFAEDTGPARRPPPKVDLVLLKTATSLGLALAAGMQSAGGRFLNGARASLRTADKAATLASLAAAGLPVPTTWLWPLVAAGVGPAPVALDPTLATAIGTGSGRWVTKPVHGIHGTGVQRHPDRESALAALADPKASSDRSDRSFVMDDGCRLLQAQVGEGDDIKVYVAGNAVFAGRKMFDAGSFESDEVDPVRLDRTTVELARRMGRVLGLRLLGIDLRDGPGGPWVVDVNAFPGYRGFPDAVEPLRAEVGAALGRRHAARGSAGR